MQRWTLLLDCSQQPLPERGSVTLTLLCLLGSGAPKAMHYVESGPKLGDRI